MTTNIHPFSINTTLYSFEIKNQALHILEKDKSTYPKPHLADMIKELHAVASWVLSSHFTLSPEQDQAFNQLFWAIRAKVITRILSSHPFVGSFCIILQKIFGFGIIGEMSLLERKFAKISKAQESTLPIYYEKKEPTHHITPRALRSLSELELASISQQDKAASQKALLAFLKSPLETRSLEQLITILQDKKEYAKILKRYEQLSCASFETKPLPKRVALKIALFVEEQVFKKGKMQDAFFHNRHTKLGRDIQISAKPKAVYVIAKSKFSTLKGEGSYKTVFSSCELLRTEYVKRPEVTACLITKSTHEELKENAIDINDTKIEVAFCKMLKGVRGFVELKTDVVFRDFNVKKMSLIFKKATGNLRMRLFEDERPISLKEKLVITNDLLFALNHLHKKKIIHADLKLDNSLYYEDRSTLIGAALCDLGFMFEVDQEKAKINTRAPDAILKWGQGGTVDYTAPELYGKKRHRSDFFALDIWSMGCILYQLHFRKKVPWAHLLIENKKNFDEKSGTYINKEALKATQEALKKKVKEEIEEHYQDKIGKKNRTQEEEFELLIYGMLRLNPLARLTSARAYEIASNLFR